jgi:hypothetical protein
MIVDPLLCIGLVVYSLAMAVICFFQHLELRETKKRVRDRDGR